MKMQQLRDMSLNDLKKKEKETREDLFKLKFQHRLRQLENPARLGQLRREIARIKTVMSEQTQN